jgi:hypothetical protein
MQRLRFIHLDSRPCCSSLCLRVFRLLLLLLLFLLCLLLNLSLFAFYAQMALLLSQDVKQEKDFLSCRRRLEESRGKPGELDAQSSRCATMEGIEGHRFMIGELLRSFQPLQEIVLSQLNNGHSFAMNRMSVGEIMEWKKIAKRFGAGFGKT